MKAKLDVMICTCGAGGLDKVAAMRLPAVDGVRYIVSCQSPERTLPPGLVRGDVTVAFSATRGLSNNRNAALALVTAPYALVADDDLVFDADGLRAVIEVFDNHPDVDIATFKCRFPFGKVYPADEHDLGTGFKGYYVASVEIAVRTDRVRDSRVAFSPLMGIGSPWMECGEESVFVSSALRSGLRGRFFPVTIAAHPATPTGERDIASAGVLRAQGAYISVAFGLTGLPRMALKAWRTPGCTARNLMYVAQGWVYGLMHRRELMHPSAGGSGFSSL